MAELVVRGRVRPRTRSGDVDGYTIRVSFDQVVMIDDDPLVVPVSGSARLGRDGEFEVSLGAAGEPTDPVHIAVVAPNGTAVFEDHVAVASLAKPLRLQVPTLERFTIAPSDDPTLGVRARITGRVIDVRGRPVASELPVVVWGIDPSDDATEPAPRPLVITATQANGHFGADWVPDVLRRAFGRVSGGPPVAIPLDDANRLVHAITLVIDVDDVLDGELPECCADTAPRAPDPQDLTANPSAFSQDLGGRCVDLTTPNRALEEFSYFMAVRTTEPTVKGVTLGVRRPVPSDLLTDLLGVAIASEAIGFTRSSRRALPTQSLTLDVDAARQLVRSDRPPTVSEIARTAWLSELGFTRGLIDAGIRSTTGRSPLDADHPVDWDDTPTIYLAIDVAHGHLLHYREVWRADGYSLGDLLYSLPLAPNQRRQVAVLDWDRRAVSAREERLEFEEELDALLSRDRDIQEIVGSELHEETSAGSRNTTWGAAGGIGAGFIGSGFGIFGGVAGGGSGSDSSSWQRSARSFSADGAQSLRDRVSQRSSALRSQRSSVVQSVAQGETLRAETEVVANYNRCHAITVEYFEVLRHLLVTHELADVQECLFVPLPIVPFTRGKALRWREPLGRYLRDRRLRRGFDAVERIADNWEGWDFPESRYSEEAPEVLEGELRISFLLPRPRDDVDGQFQIDMWEPFSPFLPIDALELFTAQLNDRTARERDRVFREEIAPGIAEMLVQQLRFAYVTADGGEIEVPMDATLVSRYAESRPLYVSLNPAGAVPSVPREDIAHVKIWYEGEPLPPDAKVIVHSGRMRYRSPHMRALLFSDARILDDLRDGDPVVVPTPVSRRELRNPREEDLEAADRLVAHLNEHLEFYHQAIWVSLDAQRRYMLLDAVILPSLGGRSIASVCTNELIGIVGNSLVLPVAPGQRLDPTLAELEEDAETRVELHEAYATSPTPPLRVSVPTRGVYAEAVSGECNACESIDDTRYWRWSTEGLLAPPEIAPVSTESRASEEPDLTPTPLPAPLVSIQNPPAAPDPFGLGAAFELLSTPELFRDITGLEGTQRNAQAAFDTALSAASALGGEAAKLAGQQELGRNAERMLDRINQARSDGLLSQANAEELASSALKGLIGESRPKETPPAADSTIKKVLDQAAQSDKADIKVSTSSETVEVSFEDDQPKVGASTVATIVDIVEFVDQAIIVEPGVRSGNLSSFVIDRRDLLDLLLTPADQTALEADSLLRTDPGDATKFQLERRLRIVHPAEPASPNAVAGSGRLPVVFIVHGNHASWTAVRNTPNHEGYTYLQEELARHGIVSVSVDTNAANFFGSMIEMRASMVLAAMDKMRALDGTSGSRFNGRLDFDKVGLVGHSRGGDAVVRVAAMNRSRPAATKFDLQAVCSLAPTDFTGTGPPPGIVHTMQRTDAPFFAVVYGALDGDVSGRGGAESFGGTGFRHYDRAATDKAMVFLDHCNHNRFNTVWTADGDESRMDPVDVAPGGRLLAPADHQQLANEYIGGLLRWRLLGQNSQLGLFDGSRSNTLGAGVSLQWSFGSQIEVIDDMEDPVKPRTIGNAFIDPFADFTIGARDLGDETNHQTAVLGVSPGLPAPPPEAYRVAMAPSQSDWSSYDLLTFRVCADFDMTSQATIAAGPLPDFTVVVTDAAGASAVVTSAAIATPQAPRRPVFHRLRGVAPPEDNVTVLRLETMSIPISTLTGINTSDIASVGVAATSGFSSDQFFDSLQLVRR